MFGQDKAIDALSAAIKMSRSGLGNPQKPTGSFLFSGPTGVGKTEVARQLAYIMGVELIRFDMSEYMERHAVSRLIGAPPGYVGFDQGGLLTEAVTKHPYSRAAARRDRKGASGRLQHPAAGDGPRHADRQQRPQGGFPQRDDHHDDQRGRGRALRAPWASRQPRRPATRWRRSSACSRPSSATGWTRSSRSRRSIDEIIMRVVDKFLIELEEPVAREESRGDVHADAGKDPGAKKGFDPQMGARPMARLIQDTITHGAGRRAAVRQARRAAAKSPSTSTRTRKSTWCSTRKSQASSELASEAARIGSGTRRAR